MSTIVLSFETTPGQDAKLAKAFAVTNALRLANGLDEYVSIEAWLTDLAKRDVKGEIGKLREVDAGEVAAAYKEASGAAQDTVRQTLGLVVY